MPHAHVNMMPGNFSTSVYSANTYLVNTQQWKIFVSRDVIEVFSIMGRLSFAVVFHSKCQVPLFVH